MKKNDLKVLEERIAQLEKLINGGKGSGNFGHSGRPGEVGGSGKGVGTSGSSDKISREEAEDRLLKSGQQVLSEFDKTDLRGKIVEAEDYFAEEARVARADGRKDDARYLSSNADELSSIRQKMEALRSCVGDNVHEMQSRAGQWGGGGVDATMKAQSELNDSMDSFLKGLDNKSKMSMPVQQVIGAVKEVSDSVKKYIERNESILEHKDSKR